MPLVLVAGLLLTYLVAPDFYLKYIIEYRRREHQALEIATTICGALATVMLFIAAARLWKRRDALRRLDEISPHADRFGWLRGGGPALVVGVVALATLFFTGEECSWGQSYLRWETPEAYRDLAGETNLHNVNRLPISINSLGSTFILAVFVGLPAAWLFRERLRLPPSWSPAIPEGPVVCTMLAGFAVKEFKSLYRAAGRLDRADPSAFYTDYVEQLNEHKELLIVVGLLMYGVYRLKATRQLGAVRSTAAGGAPSEVPAPQPPGRRD